MEEGFWQLAKQAKQWQFDYQLASVQEFVRLFFGLNVLFQVKN